MFHDYERRRRPRVDIDVYLEEVHFCGRQLGRTLDISEAGIRYLTGLTAPPRGGEDVFIELRLPDDEFPVRALGRVVGRQQGQMFSSTSVAFTTMTQDDALRIRHYVKQQLASA